MTAASDTLVKRRVDEARLLAGKLRAILEGESAGEERALLAAYAEAIRDRDLGMKESGIGDVCSRCAARTGSCCFTEIAEEYDVLLLAVNLLLDCDLPDSRYVEEGCYFVGPEGCRLDGRFAFCLNYLCPEVRSALGEVSCNVLQLAVGRELSAGFELERSLRRLLTEL